MSIMNKTNLVLTHVQITSLFVSNRAKDYHRVPFKHRCKQKVRASQLINIYTNKTT